MFQDFFFAQYENKKKKYEMSQQRTDTNSSSMIKYRKPNPLISWGLPLVVLNNYKKNSYKFYPQLQLQNIF